MGQKQSHPARRERPLQGSVSANQIVSYLFVGNYASAASREFLTSNGIRFVLNMTPYEHDRLPGIEYLQLSAGDVEDFNLSQHFEAGHAFIEKARTRQSKVLVHCEMGISRSATIAMAHLMIQGHDPEDNLAQPREENSDRQTLRQAWDVVRKNRSCCCPNEGFFQQLLHLEKNLLGKTSMTSFEYEQVAHTAQTAMQIKLFDSLSDSCK